MAIPFLRSRVDVRYYDVDARGDPDWAALLALAADRHTSPLQIALINDTFGYPADVPENLVEKLKGVFDVVVRDAAHSLPGASSVAARGRHATFTVYSLRKPLPVAEGALVTVPLEDLRDGSFDTDQGTRPSATHAAYLAFEWAARAVPELRLAAPYRWVRANLRDRSLGLPLGALSQRLLRCIDVPRVIGRRRTHARWLHQYFDRCALRPDHDRGAPLYFPLRVRDVDAAVQRLRHQGIETFSAWTLQHVPDVRSRFPMSHHLARSIIGVPVHQDLGGHDLDRIASAVTGLEREGLLGN